LVILAGKPCLAGRSAQPWIDNPGLGHQSTLMDQWFESRVKKKDPPTSPSPFKNSASHNDNLLLVIRSQLLKSTVLLK